MLQLLSQKVDCPYCGEQFEALIDTSEENNQYTEDCYVCCRPIVFVCFKDHDDTIIVSTHSENDSF